MSSTRVIESILPRLAEFGVVGADGSDVGVVSGQAPPKIRVIGPGTSKRVSRGLTRAIRRPSEHGGLAAADIGDHGHQQHHHQQQQQKHAQQQQQDMTISTHPGTAHLHLLTLDVDDDNDDAFDELGETRGGTPLACETPIPPLPRARVPSRLGAVSAHIPELQESGELAAQGMIMIGRPASTASYNRINVSQDDQRKRGRSSLANTPSSPLLRDDTTLDSAVTSVEEDLKHLLLCQSMGIKIVTSMKDFVPGTVAQLVFHCPRCLKHWKLSGKPQAPGACDEPDQPTQGPEFNITTKSHQIMKQLDMLPKDDKQHLIKVLSRTGSPGAEEELLELVNSTSSDFLRQSSASPHASRRSRSPEKRSIKRLSMEREALSSSSPSPVERTHPAAGVNSDVGLMDHKRWRSAHRERGNTTPRPGAASPLTKYSSDRFQNVTIEENPVQESSKRTFAEHQVGDVERNGDHRVNMDDDEQSRHEPAPPTVIATNKEDQPNRSQVSDTSPTIQNQDSKDFSVLPTSHNPRKIPRGERSATGETILEFQDIDGAKYHGFLSSTGQFVPIARLDAAGNRLPVAMKPDGSFCVISKHGCQTFSSTKLQREDLGMEESASCFGEDLIDIKDSLGATIRGYKNIGGNFVPIAQIDGAGNKQAVLMKPDGRYYVQNDSTGLEDDKVEQFVKFEDVLLCPHTERTTDVADSQDQAVRVQTNITKTLQVGHPDKQTEQQVTEFEGHDGFKYQGFNSPGLGFVPTARLEKGSEKSPIVLNKEGWYSVVNKSGVMEDVNLQCHSEGHSQNECSVCQILDRNRSKSRVIFKKWSSSSSSYSSESTMTTSASQTEVRTNRVPHKPDMDGVMHVDHLTSPTPKSTENVNLSPSQAFNSLTLRRGLDGSLYHGRCYSDHFVPVFRLDDKGIRHPVLSTSTGKYYTIDSKGHNRCIEDDEEQKADSLVTKDKALATREHDGCVLQGNYTIDGRFVPVARIDEQGNRQPVVLTKNGKYLFFGRQGKATYISFTEEERKSFVDQGHSDGKSKTLQRGDDGFVYEGHSNHDGEFIPTFRVDDSGFRQIVLKNSKGQGYIIGVDGKTEFIPFSIKRNRGNGKKSKRRSHESSPKQTSAKLKHDDQLSHYPDNNEFFVNGAISQSSHIQINSTAKNHMQSAFEKEDRGTGAQYQTDGSKGKNDDSGRKLRASELGNNYSSVDIDGFTAWPHEHPLSQNVMGDTGERSELDGHEMYYDGDVIGNTHGMTSSTSIKKQMRKSSLNRPTSSTDPVNTSLPSNYSEESDGNSGKVPDQTQLPRKKRDSTVSYLGVTDVKASRESVTAVHANGPMDKQMSNKRMSDAPARDKRLTAKRDEQEGEKKPPSKNTAVHNVTGRPDMKAGLFKKHVFATPHADLANTKGLGMTGQDSFLVGDSANKPSPNVMLTGNTRLPSLPQISQLPERDKRDRSSNTHSSGQIPEGSLPILPSDRVNDLPAVGHRRDSTMDPIGEANELPPVDKTRRGSRADKIIQKKVGPENRRRASKAPAADISKEPDDSIERIKKDEFQARSPSPVDLLTKFSRFKLTADQPLSPSPPPPSSDSQPSYRMTYSTLPGRLRSPTLPMAQKFSSEQSKSPEPSLFQKRLSPIQISNLPDTCEEFIIPTARVSSGALKKAVTPSSRTSMVSRASTRLLGPKESLPDCVSRIWQQHQMEVEALRQSFQLSLTSAFTFSIFQLPLQYAEQNASLIRKAKQIRTLKKPTKLGKPPTILQKGNKPPVPLKRTKTQARQTKRLKA